MTASPSSRPIQPIDSFVFPFTMSARECKQQYSSAPCDAWHIEMQHVVVWGKGLAQSP